MELPTAALHNCVVRTDGRLFGKMEIWLKYTGWVEITSLVWDSAFGYSVIYPDQSGDSIAGSAQIRIHE